MSDHKVLRNPPQKALLNPPQKALLNPPQKVLHPASENTGQISGT